MELLRRFVEGRDQRAFEVLVRRYGHMVLGVSSRLLPNRQDVEDAFQATFMTLATRAHSIQKRGSLSAWLHGVALRVSRNLNKQNAKWRRRIEMSADNATCETPVGTDREVKQLLDEELDRLPQRLRELIVLVDLEGLTRSEAARRLAVPPGTVSSRLARGRELLKQRLVRRGVQVSVSGIGVVLPRLAEAAPTLPDEMVRETVSAATLYASGTTAGLPVSNHTVVLTREVIHTMLLAKLTKITTATFLVAAALLLASPIFSGRTSLRAETILLDDFSKGIDEWTRVDWTLGTPFGPGSFSLDSGAFRISSPRPVPPGSLLGASLERTAAPEYANGFLRGKIRASSNGTFAFLTMRYVTHVGPDDFYLFGGSTRNGEFAIERTGGEVVARSNAPDLSFNVGEEWIMEAGAVDLPNDGTQLSLRVWKPGTPEPTTPQLSVVVPESLGPGVLGFAISNPLSATDNATISATFDDVYFTPVPEPGGLRLGLSAVLGLLPLSAGLWRRRSERVESPKHGDLARGR